MRILFVCMGNICRSPTAEGVFRQRVEQAGLGSRIEIDSAGTGDWHVGKAPDSRACAAAGKRGYQLTALRARQVQPEDFLRFDLILAMDHDNLARLEALRPEASRAELDLLLRRYDLARGVVPDPYYGETDGFEEVLDLLEEACDVLLVELKGRL
ncbi:low molecular weight protein-tyrosine-phosphatase [Stutzerimonas chloritidismutans]|uniref:low molecular weight protein-tyrosine-phosphatase n=1 Tax=Stutzerimonas chloritidismutans TaxID=203192 RepID=UPI001D189333|nr:low molecular weight protein-tyrosine-phosphatase [Stutzerimonas chloritidismutans]UEG62954.1 low molecular weight phosphotyrosine protein phosphatase [Stutzerimonas chloritidismutans]